MPSASKHLHRGAMPGDSEAQAMSDAELQRLWSRRPDYPDTASALCAWVIVAKEVRHRNRFRPGSITHER